jgi:hypothetical protein
VTERALAEAPYRRAWTAQAGTSADDVGNSLAVDPFGNTYISGSSKGALGGPAAGFYDPVLIKLDTAGNELWSRQFGTDGFDDSYGVAVDGAGNAYLSGYTWGGIGGPSVGGGDGFLVKYDPSGNELWTKQIATDQMDSPQSVAVDAAGNAYVCGHTKGSFDGPNAGDRDMFLVKLDPMGNQLWARQMGTPGYDLVSSVAVDPSGNVFVTGWTEGELCGPQAGNADAYLVKFDAAGNRQWAQQFGTPSVETSRSVTADASGNAYVAGYTFGDLGGPSGGAQDAYLVKFDAAGNELWSHQAGLEGREYAYAVAVDDAGGVFLGGHTTSDFGGPSAGSYDAFLVKLDEAGNELWVDQIGTDATDIIRGMDVDGEGNVYVGGYTSGDFGAPGAGEYDMFVAKYQVPEPASLSLLILGGLTVLRRRN